MIKSESKLTAELIIFYDGYCPLCVKEMKKLHKLDHQHQLELIDIQQPEFNQLFPHINKAEASSILLGQLPTGDLIRGLDTSHKAWSIVGKGWRTAWMRWPIICWFTDIAYLFFARNRYSISRLFTGKARCDSCGINTASVDKNKNE